MRFYRFFTAIFCLFIILSLLAAAGCARGESGPRSNSGDKKPIVAVTILPQQTFVKLICGDTVEIVTLIPPGYSPENYEPAARQMQRLSTADIYFSIGLPIEKTGILESAAGARLIHLEDAASRAYPDREFSPGERDPHIWLSPKRVKAMAGTIAREMSLLIPENEGLYGRNAREFMDALDALSGEISEVLKTASNKKFIVFHPAFGYFADDFGLDMYALEEDGKEATPRRLRQMTDLAKAENIRVIFYQEEIDSGQSKAFAEEIGGKTMLLAPLAENYTENLKNMAKAIAEAA